MAASKSLLDQELLLATPSVDGLADGVLEEEREIEVIGVTDASGRSVLPAFSTEQSLLRWATDGSPHIALDGRTVLGLFIAGAQWDSSLSTVTAPTRSRSPARRPRACYERSQARSTSGDIPEHWPRAQSGYPSCSNCATLATCSPQ
jgi:hypothetical protein